MACKKFSLFSRLYRRSVQGAISKKICAQLTLGLAELLSPRHSRIKYRVQWSQENLDNSCKSDLNRLSQTRQPMATAASSQRIPDMGGPRLRLVPHRR